MRPKTQPKSARKLKFAGQIRELAKSDILTAAFFAQRGRIFTEIESLLTQYYWMLDKFKALKSGQEPIEKELLKEAWTEELSAEYSSNIQNIHSENRMRLCNMVLSAIENRDADKILEIGKAVRFLKTFKDNGDRCRSIILGLKSVFDRHGSRMTIKELARAVDWPMNDAKHGFWRLRRIAKELNFPLKSQHK